MNVFNFPAKELEKRHKHLLKKKCTYKGMLKILQKECDSFPWDSRVWLAVLHRSPKPGAGDDCRIEVRIYAATDTKENTERYQTAIKYTHRLPCVVIHHRIIAGSLKTVMNDALVTIRMIKSMAETLTVLETTK